MGVLITTFHSMYGCEQSEISVIVLPPHRIERNLKEIL